MTSLRTQAGLQGGLSLTENTCRIAFKIKKKHPPSCSLTSYTLPLSRGFVGVLLFFFFFVQRQLKDDGEQSINY